MVWGETAWGGRGWIAILFSVGCPADKTLKEVWEQGVKISEGGTIQAQGVESFLEAGAFLVCSRNSKG